MKITFYRPTLILLIYLMISGNAASQVAEDITITGEFNNTPFSSLISFIQERSDAGFFYNAEWFEDLNVNISANHLSIEKLLDQALADKPFTYLKISNNFVFMPKQSLVELTGKFSSTNGEVNSEGGYIMIGNPDEAGRFRTVDVTGKVNDGKTGEPVIGATIQIENTLQGAVTNVDGLYRLTMEPGLYTLIISSVGYESTRRNLRVLSNGVLDVELFDKAIQIEDIIVYGERVDKNVTSQQMSLLELDTRTIKQLPSVSGSRDVIKGLTLMPGVKSVGEFSSGINVRGGGEDQNLYLFNSAPLFNTSHVFGLFSVINPDMVDKLTLYKGHIPAVYGERVSSVIEIRTRETAPGKITLKGGIGLYDSRLMVQVPVLKDKVFIELGGRSSYSDWLLKRINDVNLSNSNASFYDLNGSVNVNLGRNRLWISGYRSFDDFKIGDEIRYGYGNYAASAGWNFIINPGLASYITLVYSRYDVQKDNILDTFGKNRIESGLGYTGFRYRIKYSGLANNIFDAGFNATWYDIAHGNQSPLGRYSLVEPASLEKEHGAEGAFFLNDEYTLNSYISFNAGLRFSGFAYTGPKTVLSYAPGTARDSSSITGSKHYNNNEIIKTYFGFEPRLSAKIQFNSSSSVKISYDRNIQYLSLISNSSVSTPADIWKLSDTFLKPLVANQIAVGYYRNFFNNTIETSAELYYKVLDNVTEYKNGMELDMISNIESQLIDAKGKNYGIELLFKKNSGKIEGWISYTYSRSLRKTTGIYPSEVINGGRYFPSSYDKPNDFTIVANYHINKRVSLSGNFSYSTGRPVTLPEYKYYNGHDYVVYFSDKNKYRIPDYSRLDITLRYDESLRLKKRWKGSWSFSVMNVFGRKNPYSIYYKEEEPSLANDFNRFALYKLYLIGRPVPTVTYNFIF